MGAWTTGKEVAARLVAQASYWFDQRVIDGLVDLFGGLPASLGRLIRSLQIGLVQFYALAMVLGLLVLLGVLLKWPVP